MAKGGGGFTASNDIAEGVKQLRQGFYVLLCNVEFLEFTGMPSWV